LGLDGQGRQIMHNGYLLEDAGSGEKYLIRSCSFSPGPPNGVDGKECFAQIRKSFMRQLPAVIDTHRIYYASAINPEMAERTLSELDALLSEVERAYPDVRYLTSTELGELLTEGRYRDSFNGQLIEVPGARVGWTRILWRWGVWQWGSLVLVIGSMILIRNRRRQARIRRMIGA
jgi:hypothetical protein